MGIILITCSQYCVVADALYSHGCDDALICYYGNSVYVEFDREAKSLDEAIESAILDIETAGIGAVVESVDSALVGLSDIVQLSGLTRQAITDYVAKVIFLALFSVSAVSLHSGTGRKSLNG